ncbi:uncharacterized protein LOC128575888 [Nycticebus coucang]|uniref:uncharacterized protein LOC128575888 n=1 Tax=Nycticebus coucang TaxID=9470 RepID=UPI00234D0099|nr:uncharacterized protein LOC128575888 [Nycticebus coucang]
MRLDPFRGWRGPRDSRASRLGRRRSPGAASRLQWVESEGCSQAASGGNKAGAAGNASAPREEARREQARARVLRARARQGGVGRGARGPRSTVLTLAQPRLGPRRGGGNLQPFGSFESPPPLGGGRFWVSSALCHLRSLAWPGDPGSARQSESHGRALWEEWFPLAAGAWVRRQCRGRDIGRRRPGPRECLRPPAPHPSGWRAAPGRALAAGQVPFPDFFLQQTNCDAPSTFHTSDSCCFLSRATVLTRGPCPLAPLPASTHPPFRRLVGSTQSHQNRVSSPATVLRDLTQTLLQFPLKRNL